MFGTDGQNQMSGLYQGQEIFGVHCCPRMSGPYLEKEISGHEYMLGISALALSQEMFEIDGWLRFLTIRLSSRFLGCTDFTCNRRCLDLAKGKECMNINSAFMGS